MSNFGGWTHEDVRAAQERAKANPKPQTPTQKMQSLGRLPGGVMNKTEAAYSRLLETRLGLGEISWFAFEPINIRLGKNCFYSVDFMVMLKSGELEAHEIKGFWTDDGLAKFKAAAAKLPFRFKAVRMVKSNFEILLDI